MQTTTEKTTQAPLVRDRLENFHGQQLLYVGWDQHTMICAPIALLVSPDLTFAELIHTVLPTTAFALHPEWSQINWSNVTWLSSDQVFAPILDSSLQAQGLGHKTFIRIRTPELNGIAGIGS